MDSGYIVLGVVAGSFALIIWYWRRPGKGKYNGGTSTRMPGEHLEGSDHIGGSD